MGRVPLWERLRRIRGKANRRLSPLTPMPAFGLLSMAAMPLPRTYREFTRYLPGIRLSVGRGTKRAAKPATGRGHAEDSAGGRRHRHAALPGEGAAERGLRRELLRQRPLRLPAAARGAVRTPAHRHRDARDGRDRIGAARVRARPRIKIMFITGFAAVALNSDSAAPKHAKVLSKPVHLRELVTEVKMLAA
jgi:hypothetical protein